MECGKVRSALPTPFSFRFRISSSGAGAGALAMNVDDQFHSNSTTANVPSRRPLYVFRLAFGAASAGLFAGICMGSLIELIAAIFAPEAQPGLFGILALGFGFMTAGSIWGAILGFTDP
jgi:F0F1-type ATP synthase membrane subunit c/vacuolar-type H+-ATPase subunit K